LPTGRTVRIGTDIQPRAEPEELVAAHSVSRLFFVFSAALVACAPPAITVPDALAVARTERTAREVELCVLLQETDERPLWQGVAEARARSGTTPSPRSR
jgi:hypothetical protein